MREIGGTTKVCGLIGNPVAHSKSPSIHNFLAEKTGYDLAYACFPVEEGNVSKAVEGAYALGFSGLNVTVPYKQEVIPFLKDIDPLAQKIGAVNTLVRCEGGFKGYNTDMPGLMRAFEDDGVDIRDKDLIILGAGGVARAVVMLLEEQVAASAFIINRNADHAEKLAGDVNRISGRNFARPLATSDIARLPQGKKYIVIQATSVGMHPKSDECVINDKEFYDHVETGYDLIFNPAETIFMKNCREAGAQAFNGSKMLLYQGIIAYEYWTGLNVSDEIAAECYKRIFG